MLHLRNEEIALEQVGAAEQSHRITHPGLNVRVFRRYVGFDKKIGTGRLRRREWADKRKGCKDQAEGNNPGSKPLAMIHP